MKRPALLRGKDLCRDYEAGAVTVHALSSVSFEIGQGEFIVVLGPSGSGKSTLLNLLGGMERPTSGEIWVGNQEMNAWTEKQLTEYRRDQVGFVFQFFNLIPSLTAKENVELAADLARKPTEPEEALSLVGLSGRQHHFPAQLSGGEQQRVAIARAIVKNPSLLLCDEPTGALDSRTSKSVVELLLAVRDRLNCPVVTITHNSQIAQVADRIFCMKDGRIERVIENDQPLPVGELEW